MQMIAEKSVGEQQKLMKQAGNEKNKRQLEITIETHSITIIRTKGKIPSMYCEHCLETVSAFTPEQVAGFFQVSITEIYQRVATKQIHLTNEGRGVALVCGNSLESNKNLLTTNSIK
jgi:hypothetical protein